MRNLNINEIESVNGGNAIVRAIVSAVANVVSRVRGTTTTANAVRETAAVAGGAVSGYEVGSIVGSRSNGNGG